MLSTTTHHDRTMQPAVGKGVPHPDRHRNIPALRSIYSIRRYYSHRLRTMLDEANRPAPSYFSRFFEKQLQQNEELRTLYIDRDPETFRGIALHLQGVLLQSRT